MTGPFLKHKIKGVHDEHLTRREIYNPNKFDIICKRNKLQDQYIQNAGIILGPEICVCKADDFLILMHGYYILEGKNIPKGEPISVLTNFGDSIGKRNKLASRPDFEIRNK